MRLSDAEQAARILKGRGYVTTRVSPELAGQPGLVVFVRPADLVAPGCFGVLSITVADVIRHCHHPEARMEDLSLMCDYAQEDLFNFRRRWTNR